MAEVFDAAVIGAGAAGMMAAAVAGQRGLRVALVDHAAKLAEKIRISGGGRCNFTNLGAGPANFLSQNPHFCRSALAAYTPRDFLDLMRRHGIAWHEKHKGQLFCNDSSESVIRMLRAECDAGRVAWRMPCSVESVARDADCYVLRTSAGEIRAAQLVLACGGMAVPQVGATDFALRLARQFGLKIVEPRPALVPLVFDPQQWRPYGALSGVALEAEVSHGPARHATRFLEDLLFTHRGLSGPAILQISSFWNPGEPIVLDLAPELDLEREETPTFESDADWLIHMQVGTCVERWTDAGYKLARLNWISKRKTLYMFMLEDKTLPVVYSASSLIKALREGSVCLMESAPVFERAVETLLSGARSMGAGAEAAP